MRRLIFRKSLCFCFYPTPIIGPNTNTEQVWAYIIKSELEKKLCNCPPKTIQGYEDGSVSEAL